MNSSNNENEREVDLGEIFLSILKHWYIVFLFGMIGALTAFLITKLFVTPQFVSTTRLYVLAKAGTTDTITNSELQAGSLLSNDYVELVKSREVLDHVIAEMNLTNGNGRLLDASTLQKKLSVSVQNNSRVVRIDVTDPDPYRACDIADAIRNAASTQIQRVMDSEAVNVVDEANIPTRASSPSTSRNMTIGGLIGILAAIVIIIIAVLNNDRIATEEDVKKYLGLSTLGLIPMEASEQGKKHSSRRKSKG